MYSATISDCTTRVRQHPAPSTIATKQVRIHVDFDSITSRMNVVNKLKSICVRRAIWGRCQSHECLCSCNFSLSTSMWSTSNLFTHAFWLVHHTNMTHQKSKWKSFFFDVNRYYKLLPWVKRRQRIKFYVVSHFDRNEHIAMVFIETRIRFHKKCGFCMHFAFAWI